MAGPAVAAQVMRAPVLRALARGDLGQAERRRRGLGRDVERLAAHHAAHPRRPGERPGQIPPAPRRKRAPGDELEGEGRSASPARTAVASSQALWTVGRPRRRTSSSMQGSRRDEGSRREAPRWRRRSAPPAASPEAVQAARLRGRGGPAAPCRPRRRRAWRGRRARLARQGPASRVADEAARAGEGRVEDARRGAGLHQPASKG
jgi:hypothetical protein